METKKRPLENLKQCQSHTSNNNSHSQPTKKRFPIKAVRATHGGVPLAKKSIYQLSISAHRPVKVLKNH